MKELKSNKAITLVALVITIIILLILAMVSIKLVFNEGIIKRAENAVNVYNTAQTNELQQLNAVENEMANVGKIPWYKLSEEEKEQLSNSDNVIARKNDGDNVVSAVYFENNSFDNYGMLMCGDNEKGIYLIMILNDDLLNEIISFGQKEKVEKFVWYKMRSSSFLDNLEIYDGASTVQLSDFAENEIYCKSYLERVIASFN